MKKSFANFLSFFVLALTTMFTGCGGDNDNSNTIPDEKKYSVVGVWENGNYFVSLSSDNFLTAYIGDSFIDSGTYSVTDDKIITCNNTYFNHQSEYTILSISDDKLQLSVKYTDFKGENHTKNLSLTKSSKTPSTKENALVGKSFGYLTNVFGTVTITYSTYNTAIKSSNQVNAKKYPLSLYYIYFDGKMYFQEFISSSTQVPTIGGWTDDIGDGKINVWKMYFTSNGQISDSEPVTDASL